MEDVTDRALEKCAEWFDAKSEPPAERRWKNIVNPNERWLFKACRYAIERRIWPDLLDDMISELKLSDSLDFLRFGTWRDFRDEQRRMALLLLLSTKLLFDHGPWTSNTLPPAISEPLRDVASSLKAPLNLALDTTSELLALQLQRAETIRKAALVAVWQEDRGEMIELTVRRLRPGAGKLYPAPAMNLVPRNSAFDAGLQNARKYVEDQGWWPPDVDVSWDLVRVDADRRRPLEVNGNSGSLAFALAVAQVLVVDPDPDS